MSSVLTEEDKSDDDDFDVKNNFGRKDELIGDLGSNLVVFSISTTYLLPQYGHLISRII